MVVLLDDRRLFLEVSPNQEVGGWWVLLGWFLMLPTPNSCCLAAVRRGAGRPASSLSEILRQYVALFPLVRHLLDLKFKRCFVFKNVHRPFRSHGWGKWFKPIRLLYVRFLNLKTANWIRNCRDGAEPESIYGNTAWPFEVFYSRKNGHKRNTECPGCTPSRINMVTEDLRSANSMSNSSGGWSLLLWNSFFLLPRMRPNQMILLTCFHQSLETLKVKQPSSVKQYKKIRFSA